MEALKADAAAAVTIALPAPVLTPLPLVRSMGPVVRAVPITPPPERFEPIAPGLDDGTGTEVEAEPMTVENEVSQT
jgi:hypothetical protein